MKSKKIQYPFDGICGSGAFVLSARFRAQKSERIEWELAMEHYYDHFMVTNALYAIVNTKSEFDQ